MAWRGDEMVSLHLVSCLHVYVVRFVWSAGLHGDEIDIWQTTVGRKREMAVQNGTHNVPVLEAFLYRSGICTVIIAWKPWGALLPGCRSLVATRKILFSLSVRNI